MVRKTKNVLRTISWVKIALKGFKFMHNILKAHLTLSTKTSKNWIKKPVTPAMEIQGINYQPSISEVLAFRILPTPN